MLEYWMQNGKAALSLINYDNTKPPKEIHFRKLLSSLYQHNGKATKVAISLFWPIYPAVDKDKRNKKGFAEFFLKQITKKPNSALTCTYCGNPGANEMTSYAFPFITQIGKYPNTYSWGQIRSLNFCQTCMLTSFAANNRLLFRANSPNRNRDYISILMFFSNDSNDLKRFYRGFIEEMLTPSFYTNLNILGKSKKRQYDKFWYPEEFLAVLVDYVTLKIKEFGTIEKNLGVLLYSFSRVSSGVSATIIYDSFDIVDDLNPFIRSFSRLNDKNPYAFRILFRNLRTSDSNSNNPGDFIDRRRFLRKILVYRSLDWKAIQALVMLNAAKHRSVYFFKAFISVIMDELRLSGKTTFEGAHSVGYRLGKELTESKPDKKINPKRLKKFLFDFRRCRRQEDFLSMLNLIQAQIETGVNAQPFTVSTEFEMAKCGFLIGFANAIFQK
jgi:hypothetical protein